MTRRPLFEKAIFLAVMLASGALLSQELPQRSVELELQPVQGSTGYDIELTRLLPDGKNSEPETFEIKSTTWKTLLSPGRYSMRTRSRDEQGHPGHWKEANLIEIKFPPPKILTPTPDEKIDGELKLPVKITWQSLGPDVDYHVTITDSQGKVVADETTKKEEYSTLLPDTQSYKVRVSASNSLVAGDSSTDIPFSILGGPLPPPQIPDISPYNTRSLTWDNVEGTEKYKVSLSREGATRPFLELETKEPQIRLGRTLPTGTYKLVVTTVSTLRKQTEPVEKTFTTTNFEADGGLHRSHETGRLHFISAALSVSSVSYQTQNFDFNTASSSTTNGARLSVSGGQWLKMQSPWGFWAQAELSALPISGPFSLYKAFNVSGMVRVNLDRYSQIRGFAGAQYLEFPDIGSDANSNYYSRTTASWGPSLRLLYSYGLNPDYSLRFSGQVWDSVGGSSPTGVKVQNQLNYNVGVGVSHQLHYGLNVVLDYSYRNEQASYAHPTGQVFPYFNPNMNTISLTSHNLIIGFELGF